MADEDEQKPPPLRIVSENPTARIDREVAWAMEQAQVAFAQFAAALLRTMAGSDTEPTHLIRQLAHLVEAINKFDKRSDRGMSAAELQQALRLQEAELDYSTDDDWRHRRWLREHGMDVIIKGALRLAAHKVLGEDPAFGGMHSTRVIEQGIEMLEELKRPSPPSPRSRPPKKELAASWDDVDIAPTTRASHRKKAGKSVGFDQSDLQELRKAIKAKDNKRIAELTAKIGRPSNEGT